MMKEQMNFLLITKINQIWQLDMKSYKSNIIDKHRMLIWTVQNLLD